jgi:GAF domain-containing protein/DNA-binding CsgD family transcriptional regulator
VENLSQRLAGHLAALTVEAKPSLSRPELCRTFASRVARALEADLAEVLEYRPRDHQLVRRGTAGACLEMQERTRGTTSPLLSQPGRAFLEPEGNPVVLEDADAPHDWPHDAHLRAAGAKSGVAAKVPGLAGGRDFGVLAAFFKRPRAFGPEEPSLLRHAATLLGGALEARATKEALASKAAHAWLLGVGVELLKLPAAPDAILAAAAHEAVARPKPASEALSDQESRPMADWCFADFLVRDNGRYPNLRRVAVAASDAGAPGLAEAFPVPLGPRSRHGAPRAVRTRAPELVPRVDECFLRDLHLPRDAKRVLRAARPFSYACVPVVGEARTHGAMGFLRCETGTDLPYTEADLDAIQRFAEILAAAIDRAGGAAPTLEFTEAEEAVRDWLDPSGEQPAVELTPTEEEILRLMSNGADSDEMLRTMGIEKSTLKTHKTNIRRKAGYAGRNDLALLARLRRLGWRPRRGL